MTCNSASTLKVIVPVSFDWAVSGRGGGQETFVRMLAKYANSAGMDLTILSIGQEAVAGGSTRVLPVTRAAKGEFEYARALRKTVKAGGIDLGRDSTVLACAEHYAWAFRGIDVPVVLISHGIVTRTLRMRHNSFFVQLFRWMVESRAVDIARRILVVSDEVAAYYLSRYPRKAEGKVEVLHVGVDLDEYEGRPRHQLNDLFPEGVPSPMVLFVGRLSPEKNVALFISACDTLVSRGLRLEAVVIGDGPERQLIKGAVENRSWLTWIPQVPHERLLDIMSVAASLVICSSYDAGPLVMLEALASGIPVVSTCVGRAEELIVPGTGLLVDANPRSVSDGLQEVLSWSRAGVRNASFGIRRSLDFDITAKTIASTLRSVTS